jgi:hypothetical protein
MNELIKQYSVIFEEVLVILKKAIEFYDAQKDPVQFYFLEKI